ncbi:GLPGLI family protein [Riemerella anatipestifer]|nr:GLPGLI family protein [Riemerella anatipestifer]
MLDHTCFKANLKFHGRNYTAWYAQDLPISDGPYKFLGYQVLFLRYMMTILTFTIKQ